MSTDGERTGPETPIMTATELAAICERQRLGSVPGTPEFDARIAALDAEDPFFAHCVRADAERRARAPEEAAVTTTTTCPNCHHAFHFGACETKGCRCFRTGCPECGSPMMQAKEGAYRGLWTCSAFCGQFGPPAAPLSPDIATTSAARQRDALREAAEAVVAADDARFATNGDDMAAQNRRVNQAIVALRAALSRPIEEVTKEPSS